MLIPLEIAEALPSTSETLKARAQAGAAEQALFARRQTAGRGRMGRSWVSPEGNLHLSILLHPRAPFTPGHWALLAAVALLETTAAHLPDPARLTLKWPNDLLLDGAKLAGILLDAGHAGPVPWLVIGIGMNLVAAPTDLGRPTAALAQHTSPPDPVAFAHALLQTMQTWRARYDAEGFPPIRSAWLRHGPRPGASLQPGASFHGLAEDGALLADTPAGVIRIITPSD